VTDAAPVTDAAAPSLDHVLAHLARLDLRLRRAVLSLRRQLAPPTEDEFRGLYISDQQADALLDRPPGTAMLGAGDPADEEAAALDRAIGAADELLRRREAGAAQGGPALRLELLRRRFGLSAFERDVLVVALAAEVDLKYERLFAYLQDDVTRKRPTVDLVLQLLCDTLPERLLARRAFVPPAPLLRWELLTVHDDPQARHPVLPARYLRLDDRVAGYLLGSDEIDARLAALREPAPAASPDSLPAETAARVGAFGAALDRDDRDATQFPPLPGSPAPRARPGRGPLGAPVFLLHGRYGSGRHGAAVALAGAARRPLLCLNASRLAGGEAEMEGALLLAEREALLTGALLCWTEAGDLLHPRPERAPVGRAFHQALARGRAPAVLLAERAWEPAGALQGRPFVRLELPETTYAERRRLWAAGLHGREGLTEAELGALAGRYRLTAGQIRDALARAGTLAWARDPGNGHLSAADVDAACRAQAQHRLSALAHQLTPRYGWEDIVLPGDELTALRLICAHIRRRPTVYGEWGFDRKLAAGKGVVALFAGQSGTGKTMAAEIIAGDLGLDLYRIDLSAVVDKYIGETEKNLEKLFQEAQDSDAILFFDEADALFGKRSGVRDAHDRYANVETAYLLQRTEAYDGLVILASNFPKNIDEAFARRLHFTITFPVPEEPERLEIWRRTFPAEAPVAPDVDLPFLARRLEITGGNIRNIILAAAFLAADEGRPISMRHLILGARQEYQKLGKMMHERDFGPYLRLVQPGA
jgi:AAA+ superfamily predicted ATPase